MLYQQGDVLLTVVLEVKGKTLNHLTLAVGEATGHHHTITQGDAVLYEDNGVMYLHVESDKASLTHQEHKTIELPKGNYQIGIIREFDHFTEEIRNVCD